MKPSQRAKRILDTIREIPVGMIASYGQVAEISGIPRGARQVGAVLRQLDADEDVPWHRVVQASGRIAFPPGSPQFREQRRRLASEGVRLCRGRVDMSRHAWRPGLDELLWKPSAQWDDR